VQSEWSGRGWSQCWDHNEWNVEGLDVAVKAVDFGQMLFAELLQKGALIPIAVLFEEQIVPDPLLRVVEVECIHHGDEWWLNEPLQSQCAATWPNNGH